MRLLLISLLFLVGSAAAAPHIVSDPADPKHEMTPFITHCGVYLNTAAMVQSPIQPDKSCKHDIASLPPGSHVVKMTFIIVAPGFGTKEGPQSSPLTFVVPSSPSAPAGLRLTP
jgi:hypothetical protein